MSSSSSSSEDPTKSIKKSILYPRRKIRKQRDSYRKKGTYDSDSDSDGDNSRLRRLFGHPLRKSNKKFVVDSDPGSDYDPDTQGGVFMRSSRRIVTSSSDEGEAETSETYVMISEDDDDAEIKIEYPNLFSDDSDSSTQNENVDSEVAQTSDSSAQDEVVALDGDLRGQFRYCCTYLMRNTSKVLGSGWNKKKVLSWLEKKIKHGIRWNCCLSIPPNWHCFFPRPKGRPTCDGCHLTGTLKGNHFENTMIILSKLIDKGDRDIESIVRQIRVNYKLI